ncbi:MAG: QacE family quaternary ammonium compound efflux SMR transporter [Rhizobiaceae bacterium]|nr:MAG: QacE family quaternary ammonium compound efflux SMR transporter [Rhizobiaceae bacterium]
MAWVILGIAVLSEIAWALGLKWASVQATWTVAAVPIILNFLNMALLSLAMRSIPTGTVYAVWTGLGAVGVAVMGAVLLGDRLNAVQIAFMTMIVIGGIGTKLYAGT